MYLSPRGLNRSRVALIIMHVLSILGPAPPEQRFFNMANITFESFPHLAGGFLYSLATWNSPFSFSLNFIAHRISTCPLVSRTLPTQGFALKSESPSVRHRQLGLIRFSSTLWFSECWLPVATTNLDRQNQPPRKRIIMARQPRRSKSR
jgi:hypothetical protein